MRPFRGVFSLFAYIRKEVWLLPQSCINEKGDAPGFQKETEVRMKTKRTKRKNKYTELRAAIAAVQRINRGLLRVLPQWRYGSGGRIGVERRCRRRVGLARFGCSWNVNGGG